MNIKIPIEVSARHIHLSSKDLEALFGRGYKLKKAKNLYQPGDFLASEKLGIKAGERIIPNVAVIGSIRSKTQIELSHTDIIYLRLKPIVRDSGDIEGTPGAILVGPKKELKIKQGVFNTWRHIHCSPKEAKKLGLKNNQLVSVKTKGKCSVIFNNVRIRIGDSYKLCMHLDTDEGNAVCIIKKGEGIIINI